MFGCAFFTGPWLICCNQVRGVDELKSADQYYGIHAPALAHLPDGFRPRGERQSNRQFPVALSHVLDRGMAAETEGLNPVLSFDAEKTQRRDGDNGEQEGQREPGRGHRETLEIQRHILYIL